MRRGVMIEDGNGAPPRSVATLPAELRVRGGQLVSSMAERVALALGGDRAVARVPRGLAREARGDVASVAQHARRQLSEGVLPGLQRTSGTVATLRRARPDAEARTRCRADRAVDGVFDLLGHERVSFGTPIDWQLDPSSGKRAPRRHWSRIDYLDPNTVGDYKLLWEVNRHQHFVTLGQAYAYSRDSRYANAFVAQLTGWLADNPPRVGVNWASSLEVSYRAISWVWALQLFADAPQLTDEVLVWALESLRAHATHISRYLSTYYSPNTHLTGEALGLLYIGTALPMFEAAADWRSHGWDILREQLFRQVRPDGTYFEQALYYHRYTADIYLHALLLAKANGWPREAAVWERTERLLDALMQVLHPDGTVPLVGDDDGGRLMRLDGLTTRDARPTLATAAALFGRSDMRCIAGDAVEECLWLLGESGAASLASRPPVAPSGGSRGFGDGGLYVMRDGWTPTSTWALLDGGPHGSLNCGHAHADALALEVATGGRPVLTDSGTCSYTGADRDAFRATSSHNSVTVDDESSSLVAGLFHWRHIARTSVNEWITTPELDFWSGSHDGYARLPDPATHRRSVLFLHGRYLVVVDVIDAARAHDWTVHWHCAPRLALRADASGEIVIEDPSRDDVSLLQLLMLGDGAVSTGQSWRSEAYGSKLEAPSLTFRSSGSGRQTAITILVPGTAHAKALRATDAASVTGAEIVGAQFMDTIMRRGSADSLEAAGVRSDADCAVVARAGDGAPRRLLLIGASYAEGATLPRATIAGGRLYSARWELGRWIAEPAPARPSVQG